MSKLSIDDLSLVVKIVIIVLHVSIYKNRHTHKHEVEVKQCIVFNTFYNKFAVKLYSVPFTLIALNKGQISTLS